MVARLEQPWLTIPELVKPLDKFLFNNLMSYSSFAERGRFDPIQVGDKTQEMVRSSSKYLDAMRENNRIDIERKKELLQAIKRKNEQERLNREANFKVEQQFKRTAREQELANYKTEINNYEVEKRESEADVCFHL